MSTLEAPPLRLNAPVAPGPGFVVILPGGSYLDWAEHEAGPVLAWFAAHGIRAGVLQ